MLIGAELMPFVGVNDDVVGVLTTIDFVSVTCVRPVGACVVRTQLCWLLSPLALHRHRLSEGQSKLSTLDPHWVSHPQSVQSVREQQRAPDGPGFWRHPLWSLGSFGRTLARLHVPATQSKSLAIKISDTFLTAEMGIRGRILGTAVDSKATKYAYTSVDRTGTQTDQIGCLLRRPRPHSRF